MPNMKNIINAHNKKMINPLKDNIARTCPLNKKCLTNNVLYKACITPNEKNSKKKIYCGVSETAFKLRYANHKKHSITSDTKLMRNYQTNIGKLYEQTKLRINPGKFWEPTNHKIKVLNDVC